MKQPELIPFPAADEWAYEICVTRKPCSGFVLVHSSTPEKAAEYLFGLGLAEEAQEHFVILVLNSKNFICGHAFITKGLIDRSHVHPREVFRPALVHGACKIIVSHNHPSGDTAPSRQDIQTTTNLIEAGELLGIPVTDHIIVAYDLHQGKQVFKSLRQEGHFSSLNSQAA